MNRSAVSIEFVVPYHGSPEYLELTVRSALGQSDPSWRMVIVQDGPQKRPLTPWLAELVDERIRFETNARTLGIAGNFQRCLDLATATHVVFLGCDDELLPDYVVVVRRALAAHPEVAAVQPGVEVVDADGRVVRPLTDRVKRLLTPHDADATVGRWEPMLTSLLHGNWLYFPSLCWRREVIASLGFRKDLPVTLDLAMLAQLLLAGQAILVIPDLAFRYRRHSMSVSSVAAKNLLRFEEERRLFIEIANACQERGWLRAGRAARWHVTSRLHGAVNLPRAIAQKPTSVPMLLRHMVGR